MNIEKRTQKTVASLIKQDNIKSRFAEVLGKRAPQFCSSVIAISQQRHLANCQPESVLASAMVAATLNLPVNPTLGLAYIVPYGGQAQFQIGYKGLVQLAIRSGQYRHLNTFAVYDGQIVRTNRRTGEVEFDDDVAETGDPVGYGAYLETVNGYQHTVYWTKEQVQQHAERFSQAYRAKRNDSPWISDFDAMAKKTVLKTLLTHWGPLSVELETAVSRDMTSQSDLDATPAFDDAVEIEIKEDEGDEVPMAPKRKRRTQAEMLADKLTEIDLSVDDVLLWASHSTGTQLTDLEEIPKPMLKQMIQEPELLKVEVDAMKQAADAPQDEVNETRTDGE